MEKISQEQLSRKITFLSFILSVGIVYIHAYNVNVYNLSGSGKAAFLIERFETVSLMVILSPAVYFIMKNRKGFHVGTIVFIISLIISLSVNLKYGESTLVFQMNRLFNNTYFFAGAFLAINHKDWVYYKNRNITAIGSILLALCIICTVLFDFFDYNNVIKNIMIPVSVWMMSNAFYFRGLPKYLQISFFIYCVHEYILEAIEKLWLIAAGASPAAALTDFLLMPVICIFIVTVISIVIRKITPGIWKVITGGR